MSNDHELAVKLVNSLCDNGFMHGCGGDISEEYRSNQIKYFENNLKYLDKNYVYGFIDNLRKYCGWSEEEVSQIAKRCNFKENGRDKLGKIIWKHNDEVIDE